MDVNEQPKTVIAEDVEITGSIKCESNIRLNGKLNGDLTSSGNALLGNTAAVKGNLSIETITIEGQVSGNIVAKDKIELKSTARMNGDIRSRRLTVEDGVTFVGKVDVNPAGHQGTRGSPPEAKPTADDAGEASDGKSDKGGILGRK